MSLLLLLLLLRVASCQGDARPPSRTQRLTKGLKLSGNSMLIRGRLDRRLLSFAATKDDWGRRGGRRSRVHCRNFHSRKRESGGSILFWNIGATISLVEERIIKARCSGQWLIASHFFTLGGGGGGGSRPPFSSRSLALGWFRFVSRVSSMVPRE